MKCERKDLQPWTDVMDGKASLYWRQYCDRIISAQILKVGSDWCFSIVEMAENRPFQSYLHECGSAESLEAAKILCFSAILQAVGRDKPIKSCANCRAPLLEDR